MLDGCIESGRAKGAKVCISSLKHHLIGPGMNSEVEGNLIMVTPFQLSERQFPKIMQLATELPRSFQPSG